MRYRPTHEEMMEIGELGDQIYEREVASQLTDADHGAIIAIDVDTGEWAVGIEAVKALDAKNDDARILTMVHATEPRMGLGGATFYDDIEVTALNAKL